MKIQAYNKTHMLKTETFICSFSGYIYKMQPSSACSACIGLIVKFDHTAYQIPVFKMCLNVHFFRYGLMSV